MKRVLYCADPRVAVDITRTVNREPLWGRPAKGWFLEGSAGTRDPITGQWRVEMDIVEHDPAEQPRSYRYGDWICIDGIADIDWSAIASAVLIEEDADAASIAGGPHDHHFVGIVPEKRPGSTSCFRAGSKATPPICRNARQSAANTSYEQPLHQRH